MHGQLYHRHIDCVTTVYIIIYGYIIVIEHLKVHKLSHNLLFAVGGRFDINSCDFGDFVLSFGVSPVLFHIGLDTIQG